MFSLIVNNEQGSEAEFDSHKIYIYNITYLSDEVTWRLRKSLFSLVLLFIKWQQYLKGSIVAMINDKKYYNLYCYIFL